jgi:hypothetical protein
MCRLPIKYYRETVYFTIVRLSLSLFYYREGVPFTFLLSRDYPFHFFIIVRLSLELFSPLCYSVRYSPSPSMFHNTGITHTLQTLRLGLCLGRRGNKSPILPSPSSGYSCCVPWKHRLEKPLQFAAIFSLNLHDSCTLRSSYKEALHHGCTIYFTKPTSDFGTLPECIATHTIKTPWLWIFFKTSKTEKKYPIL